MTRRPRFLSSENEYLFGYVSMIPERIKGTRVDADRQFQEFLEAESKTYDPGKEHGRGHCAALEVMVDKVIAIPRNKIAGRAGALSADALKKVVNALRPWLEPAR